MSEEIRAAGSTESDTLDLSQLLDDVSQRIAAGLVKLPAQFTFVWKDRRFRSQLRQDGASVKLRLCANLGPLPYTMENREARARLRTLAEVKSLIPEGHYTIGPNQHIYYCNEVPFEGELNSSNIIKQSINFIFRHQAYYDIVSIERMTVPKALVDRVLKKRAAKAQASEFRGVV